MKKMVYLKESNNPYHQRRLEKHGAIYFVVWEFEGGDLYKAKSLATGVVCTLHSRFCMEADDVVAQP